MVDTQQLLFPDMSSAAERPLKAQLLKWIGNKQRFAHQIASCFPVGFETYYEPFLGSGAVLGTLAPKRAFASDAFAPLVEIWQALKKAPETLKGWYSDRWLQMKQGGDKKEEYERIKASYNARPNGADLVFLCRSCYGGVVRFRKADGFMSTPCGPHNPISPESFSRRVDQWHRRTKGATFAVRDFEDAMDRAKKNSLVYCDPPYAFSQGILYGAQEFSIQRLFGAIERCKVRGVYVALSIDGSKKSGDFICDIPIPSGLFDREVVVNCGRSMLKRLQMNGKSLESELVADRLLLTY